MIKIEVSSTAEHVKEGISTKSGKPYRIREQSAYAHIHNQDGTPKPHPVEIRLTLDDNQPPYPAGLYTLAPESLYVGGFGSLQIRPRLRPLAASTNKPVEKAA